MTDQPGVDTRENLPDRNAQRRKTAEVLNKDCAEFAVNDPDRHVARLPGEGSPVIRHPGADNPTGAVPSGLIRPAGN